MSSTPRGPLPIDAAIGAFHTADADPTLSAADRQHAAGVDLTPADETAYEASRDERETISIARHEKRLKRARTAGH